MLKVSVFLTASIYRSNIPTGSTDDSSCAGFEKITVNYGTDVANFEGNHTKYLYGPGSILVAHGPNEALKLKDLETAVEGFKALILHSLKS
jgi:acetylornithine deacetylase